MQITHNFIAVEAALATGQRPVDLVPRDDRRWLVLTAASTMDDPAVPALNGSCIKPEYAIVNAGSVVCVELLRCKLPPATVSLAGYFASLGVAARGGIQEPVRRLHLSIGTPIKTTDDGHTVYLGLAFQLGVAD